VALVSKLLGSFIDYFFAYFANLFTVLGAGGWIVFFVLIIAILYKVYMNSIQTKFILAIKWTFLKIKVSEENQRNPRSMEEAFNAMHGMEKKLDLLEVYLDGFVQTWYSLEIRGTNEGVSFIIRVPTGNVPLLQAAIYAQYPDAEIEEVPDYTASFPIDRLEKDFDLWGTEMILAKESNYPIKSYIEFEDTFAEESRFVDSIAAISEVVGNLKPGEEIWIQITARPAILEEWREKGQNLALKLAGREVPTKKSFFLSFMEVLGNTVHALLMFGSQEEAKKDTKNDLGILKLTPGEVDRVKAIQRNSSKAAYESQIRLVYVGATPVFSKRLRAAAMLGLFRQYMGANSFRPSSRFTTSRPVYGFVKKRQAWRKRRLLQRYQWRYFAENGYELNVESLATLFHFPVEYSKAPSIERSQAKRGEAPHNVPLASDELPLA
jgi:hypothetical protein